MWGLFGSATAASAVPQFAWPYTGLVLVGSGNIGFLQGFLESWESRTVCSAAQETSDSEQHKLPYGTGGQK